MRRNVLSLAWDFLQFVSAPARYQKDSNQSPQGQGGCPLCRADTAPLGESGGAVDLKEGSAGETAFLVEMEVSFVDGSFFARVFLRDVDQSRLRSFVRPLCAVHLTAGLDEVRMPGP
ncbi:MAG: hypothetical protein RIF37_14560, partial [Rhodospirillaceae bacterium]